MMKRFLPLRNYFLFIFLIFSFKAISGTNPYYYQIKIYHIKTSDQEKVLDSFLKAAYIPALHKAGIPKVGVFKLREPDTSGQKVYVFIPFKTWNDMLKTDAKLNEDLDFQNSGKFYMEAPYNNAPYIRIETLFLKAFAGMPMPEVPQLKGNKSDRVYELRSYESPTEKMGLNKIGMFNDREMSMFTQLKMNPVFYGQVLAGSRMPNLMYMTSYENKAERDKLWASFGEVYKSIRDLPQYLNNISHIQIFFLYPSNYSDF